MKHISVSWLAKLRWFDYVVIPIWVIVLVLLGMLTASLFAERYISTAWLFLWIFVAVLVIPPVARLAPAIVRRLRERRRGEEVEEAKE